MRAYVHFTLQALRLEPYLVISNQTGIPLQLMQPRGVQHSFSGVVPSRATRDGLPRAGVPPAGRLSVTGQGPPSGLPAAISAPDADYASTVDLPTGDTCEPEKCALSCFLCRTTRYLKHCWAHKVHDQLSGHTYLMPDLSFPKASCSPILVPSFVHIWACTFIGTA